MEERLEAVAGKPAPLTAPEAPAVDIEAIVRELKDQGLEVEAIIEALKQQLAEGKITEEELQKGIQIAQEGEKEEASKLFGVDIL